MKQNRPTPGHFGVAPDDANHVALLITVDTVRFLERRDIGRGMTTETLRAELPRATWLHLKASVQQTFAAQLRDEGKPSGTFSKGETRLDRATLGRELIVLAWALELARPDETETILAAWTRMHPVERWWLYNQTVPLHGPACKKGRGWRAAIYHALAAVPTGPEREPEYPAPTPPASQEQVRDSTGGR